MAIRTWYNPPDDPGIDFSNAPSQCQEQFAAECDINVQIARFMAGDLSVLKRTGLAYDASGAPEDLQSALNFTVKAREIWDAAPLEIRNRFSSPERLIDFLADENNRDEAIKLGLVSKKVEKVEPVSAPVVSAAQAAEPSKGEPAPTT